MVQILNRMDSKKKLQAPLGTRLKALYWFLIFNIVISFGIAYSYILSGNGLASIPGAIFVHLALLGQISLVSLVLGLIIIILTLFLPLTSIFRFLCVLLFSLLNCFLFLDTKIYNIFKFHFNGLVINVLFSPDGFGAMQLPDSQIIIGVGVILAIFIVEYFLIKFILHRLIKAPKQPSYAKKWIKLAVFILCVGIAERVIYAVSDLYNYPAVTKNVKLIPFYQPTTIKGTAEQKFAFAKDTSVQASSKNGLLNYPSPNIIPPIPKEAPSILWILSDGFRADLLTPEVTPNIFAYAQKAQNFTNHWSGGNSTRFGVFTMFYALYGTYWNNFLGENRGPIFIDKLKEANYKFNILSATSLRYPEFRRTVFTAVLPAIFDTPKGPEVYQKDKELTAEFEKFLNTVPQQEKFMSFVFFDSTHLPFSFPPEYRKFTPDSSTISYLNVSSHHDVLPDFNRYKNALSFADSQVKILLDTLSKYNRSNDTIVIITSDHGQEFYERGHYGHSSAFTPEQTRVPLIMYVPGKEPAVFSHTTEHYDVVPTLFDLLGVKSNYKSYSFGKSLFDTSERPYVVSCGFSECSIKDSKGWLEFGTESYTALKFNAYDINYQDIPNSGPAVNERLPNIKQFMSETRTFLKE